MERRLPERRIWQLKQDQGNTGEHGEDLDDWNLDDNVDEWECGFGRLETTWGTQDATNKVPEELAIEESIKGGPDGIDAGGH